ncbi:hypothetical protein [Rosistilla ulvae]|nr:hypothetical protein [Rosistilla ulvae]
MKLTVFSGLALLFGCEHSELPVQSGMTIVFGTVTIDQQPLDYGQISFIPSDPGDHHVPDGEFIAAIEAGRFEIEILPGTHRVEIVKNEGLDPDVPGQIRQVLPERYNVDSELVATVEMNPSTELAFALASSNQ